MVVIRGSDRLAAAASRVCLISGLPVIRRPGIGPGRKELAMRRGVRIMLPSALLIAVIAGHTALWVSATDHLKSGFAAWVAQRRAAGWQIEAGSPARGGWPLAATLTIPDLSLSAGPADAPGRIAWRADRVVLSLSVRHPDLLGIDVDGTQTARVLPAPAQSFTADQFHIDAALGRISSGPVASIVVRALRGEALTIGLLSGQVSTGTDPAVTTSVEAIDLPTSDAGPFGRRISSLAIDATLHGGLPRPGTLTESAAAWRDGGGSVEVTHFALGWGPLGVSATGQVALDDRLQPIGTADLHVVGYAKALEALAAQRVITNDAALAATAVATLLAHVPQDGGAPEVEMPLTLRGGKLLMGRTPLLKVPEVRWPQR